ncbi:MULTISPECIES: hypothetical protein [Proteus]|uniref:hypothetical protein n=1 Tax=Proteus TaxID=583 RepID=UPI00288A1969|nr:hypothetical protein [Proteus columbae]
MLRLTPLGILFRMLGEVSIRSLLIVIELSVSIVANIRMITFQLISPVDARV